MMIPYRYSSLILTSKIFSKNSDPAKDGQYKVHLLFEPEGLELNIVGQGRFNVEAYVGYQVLAQSLSASKLRDSLSLTHTQVQTMLASIGNLKGFDVWVPASDSGKLDWSLSEQFQLRNTIPPGNEEVEPILSEIDVLWVERGKSSIEGLFEVEHSTPVYSGLLRFNDVLLTNPNVTRFSVVANSTRRSVFSRQVFRPTFRRSGLSKLVSFLEYPNVLDWHSRLREMSKD